MTSGWEEWRVPSSQEEPSEARLLELGEREGGRGTASFPVWTCVHSLRAHVF